MNHLMGKVKDQEQKLFDLQENVHNLTGENAKLKADMKILREEHTEVLHSMFQLEKRNQDLENRGQHQQVAEFRGDGRGIDRHSSAKDSNPNIHNDRSEV